MCVKEKSTTRKNIVYNLFEKLYPITIQNAYMHNSHVIRNSILSPTSLRAQTNLANSGPESTVRFRIQALKVIVIYTRGVRGEKAGEMVRNVYLIFTYTLSRET